jgi:hypothetical protein
MSSDSFLTGPAMSPIPVLRSFQEVSSGFTGSLFHFSVSFLLFDFFCFFCSIFAQIKNQKSDFSVSDWFSKNSKFK